MGAFASTHRHPGRVDAQQDIATSQLGVEVVAAALLHIVDDRGTAKLRDSYAWRSFDDRAHRIVRIALEVSLSASALDK